MWVLMTAPPFVSCPYCPLYRAFVTASAPDDGSDRRISSLLGYGVGDPVDQGLGDAFGLVAVVRAELGLEAELDQGTVDPDDDVVDVHVRVLVVDRVGDRHPPGHRGGAEGGGGGPDPGQRAD